MPIEPRRPEALRNKFFRGRDVVRRGLLTRDELRSSAWRSLFRGIYVDSKVTVTHKVRCLVVISLLTPPGSVIAGRSAAYLYGVRFIAEDDPVEVLVPPGFGRMEGLQVHRGSVPPAEQHRSGRIVMTNPIRTCWDLARWLDVVEAVVYIDVMLARRLVTSAALMEFAEKCAGIRGWRSLQRAVELADGRAESPQETRLRVRLTLSGVVGLVAQHVVTHDGHFVARVDLALRRQRIAVEYDGGWHADRAQLERDRRRLNRLIGAGWIVLHVTANRMRDDFAGILREIKNAIKLRG